MVDPLTSLASGRYGRAYRRAVRAALAPAYRFYTARLRAAVMAHPRPHHVAVIMDGNRRWASAEGYAPGIGHRRGAEKALELIDWCAELGIREVTLWALSIENLERPADEVGAIAEVAADAISAISEGRRKRASLSTSGSSAGAISCPTASPRSSTGRPRCRGRRGDLGHDRPGLLRSGRAPRGVPVHRPPGSSRRACRPKS